MAQVLDALASAISNRQAILFAGAGVSMSIGLPSWRQLIEHMGKELDLPPSVLANPGNTYQALAEYYRISQGSIGPLRSWMDRNWKVSAEQAGRSRLHELIIALDFPIIYTTNYDRNMEAAFQAHGREYVKVANARDIAKTRDGVTQIVKFHGDFDDDASLIITETDYFDRLSFDSPLDIKFRADALGKSVLFVGYSMTDLNIRLLLHRLWKTWQQSGLEKDRPISCVFMAHSDPVQEAVLGQWGITIISGNGQDHPQEALIRFLSDLQKRTRALQATAAGTRRYSARRRESAPSVLEAKGPAMANEHQQQGTGKHPHKSSSDPRPHTKDGEQRDTEHRGAQARSSDGSRGGDQHAGGGSDDLKQREYRDGEGNVHHHTRTYMEQHEK
jgi:hypothetical protein